MLDRIVYMSDNIKYHLIQMGFELPPVVNMHNNKMKQMHMNFKQMAQVICKRTSPLLFDNAAFVFTAIMSEHANITNLQDLLEMTEKIHAYVSSY